jgi:hypothetical protein
MRRFPPADNRAKPLKPKLLAVLNFFYPIPQTGCMLNNKRGAMGGQDIILETIEINRFLNIGFDFFGIPGSRMNEAVIGPLLGRIPDLVRKFLF